MSTLDYGEGPIPYCPTCGESPPENPDEEKCELCGENRAGASHHVSYLFDITIRVCSECHGRIHDSTEKYEEYQPAMPRKVAIEKGFLDPNA